MQRVADLTICFRNSIPAIRRTAFEESAKASADSRLAQELLAALLQEREHELRELILKALVVHSQDLEDVRRTLPPILFSPEEKELTRLAAAEAYASAGGERGMVIAAAIVCMKSPEIIVRRRAMKILTALTGAEEILLTFLTETARDEREDEEVRHIALCKLQLMGERVRDISPLLTGCLLTSRLRILSDALYALKATGVNRACVPGLIAALNYTDPQTHHVRNRYPGLYGMDIDMHLTVVTLLGTLGQGAEEAIPVLEELLQRDTDEREARARIAQRVKTEFNQAFAATRHLRRGSALQPVVLSYWEQEERVRTTPLRLTSEEAQVAAREALRVIRGEQPGVTTPLSSTA